ncbi:MAG: GNAT family N-acetyltransferase [Nitriliruptorales bacterium]|nr:GNAT family N-acetyltransferase [Nitriliruptorales bacterium]
MNALIRPLTVDHLDMVMRFREVSFGRPPDEQARRQMRSALDRGEIWGLPSEGETTAVTRLSLVDHWFGGRRVPCQQVASVAVPPEHRGTGAASTLMRAAIDHGIAQGAGLSLLYPATTALYRRLGWEHSGSLLRYRLKARHAPQGGPKLRVAGGSDRAAIRRCHETAGRALTGPAVRPGDRWEEVFQAPFVYVLDAEDGDGLEAYVCYGPSHAPGDWQYSLAIADWGATTARGMRALLGFLAKHGTIGKDATFTGALPHPWTFFISEQDVHRESGMFWMARGLALPVAIERRGFPPRLSLTVTFAVDDPLVPAMRGPWRLEVHGGSGKLSPSRDAAVTLDARAVGPLYTGFTSAEQLALADLARGPTDDLSTLGTAFAGPSPVLFDFF